MEILKNDGKPMKHMDNLWDIPWKMNGTYMENLWKIYGKQVTSGNDVVTVCKLELMAKSKVHEFSHSIMVMCHGSLCIPEGMALRHLWFKSPRDILGFFVM